MGFDASEPSEASTRVVNTIRNRMERESKINKVIRPNAVEEGQRTGQFTIEIDVPYESEFSLVEYLQSQEFIYNRDAYELEIIKTWDAGQRMCSDVNVRKI